MLIPTTFRSTTIYAYDVVMRANSPFLCNRRVFAVPIAGIPMSVKCDDKGFVYAGCADGIEIWDEGGILQAVIEIPGTFFFPLLPCIQQISNSENLRVPDKKSLGQC